MQDCLIIGGGIIGLLTARELAQTGLRVTLVERQQTGRESSWAGGGILSPLYPWRYPDAVSDLARWSQDHYPELADALEQESGVDPEHTASGLLVLDTEEVRAAANWAGRRGVSLEVINRTAIARLESELFNPPDSALWLPDIAQIRNPLLLRSARLSAECHLRIIEQTEVTGIEIEGTRAVGISTSRGRLDADQLVVCAGAWTGTLLSGLINPPDIRPVLGQMIMFRGQPGLISRILLNRDRYAIPRRDGRVLVGSTVEHRDFAKVTSENAFFELKGFALERFPRLAGCQVEKHWAGLRPSSPAGIPYIGRYPGIDGLYVNSGHFRNGLVLAPASARLLADLLLARKPILPPEPYALDACRSDGAQA